MGPANRKDPIGFSSFPRPERAIFIAVERPATALSWPKITILRLRSRFLSTLLSDADTVFGGIRAILDTMSSISPTEIVFRRLLGGTIRWRAPASSITSIALSGRNRSLINRLVSSTADRRA